MNIIENQEIIDKINSYKTMSNELIEREFTKWFDAQKKDGLVDINVSIKGSDPLGLDKEEISPSIQHRFF